METNEVHRREMSGQAAVNTLLWALNELGVKYVPRLNQFEIVLGSKVEYTEDPVTAAVLRRDYLRAKEVQADQTYPFLVDQFADRVENEILPQLKASNTKVWSKKMEEVLDEFIFTVRKTNATA